MKRTKDFLKKTGAGLFLLIQTMERATAQSAGRNQKRCEIKSLLIRMLKTKKGSTSKKEGNLNIEISLFFRTRITPLRKVLRSIEEGNARCVFV